MAKITPISLVAGMSGKIGQNSDTYFVTNRQTGQVHTAKISSAPLPNPTPAQIEARNKFTQRTQNTSQWLASNGPTSDHPKGTEIYQKALAAYKTQHKIGSFFGYIASRIADDGTVTIGGSR